MNIEPNAQRSRELLAGKRIFLFQYSHLDWAWCFSRRWHEARYVRINDEVLALAGEDPSFHFFVDSLAENLEHYFEWRPDALAAWQKLVKEGRFTLVGGHYSNLRPATAPEETYIRNIEEGRRILAEWFPGFEPRGFANVDTAIGHSQLPQVLSLAGFEYHLSGRPELALELDGVPKMFRWRGHGDSELITLVQHYGILSNSFMKMARADGEAFEKAKAQFLGMLERHAELPVDTLYAFISNDDTRPLRDLISDELFDCDRVIDDWNRDEDSEMLVATPDQFFETLAPQREKLPSLEGPVDQADVGYNGPFSQPGLRVHRDQAAAKLVEAEIYGTFASLKGAVFPELREAWRRTIRAQSHAIQFMFGEDVDAMRLDLLNACDLAELARREAQTAVVSACLPQDTETMTLFSSRPHRAKQIVRVPVFRTDFEVAAYEVTDASGRRLLQQAVELRNPPRPGDWEILVESDVPACGTRSLRLAEVEARSFSEAVELPLDGNVAAGDWEIEWKAGQLVSLKGERGRLEGSDGMSILEPLVYPSETRGWMLMRLEEKPERTVFQSLRQTEFGPLRWRFERCGSARGHDVFQDLQVFGNGRLEVVTTINHGVDTCCFGLAMPCPTDASLKASIPFGVEERDLSSITYSSDPKGARMLERVIPGMFYARDWVQANGAGDPVALVVMDGDRYWLRPPGKDRLVHLLLNCMRPEHDGWVSYTQMDRAGYMSFRHTLVIGEDAADVARLSHVADEARFPVRVEYTAGGAANETDEWLRVEPNHLRMLACRMIDDEVEIRLVESAGRNADVRVSLCGEVDSARLTDLRGETLPDTVQLSGSEMRFSVSPWQLRNLRIKSSASG